MLTIFAFFLSIFLFDFFFFVLSPVNVSLYLTLISVSSFSHFSFDFDIFLSFSVWFLSPLFSIMSRVVDDRAAAFLEEVRRAMEVSRQEAGVPAPTVAPSLADVAAAVRESGLAGALNNIAARTISHGVRFFMFTNLSLNFIGTV